ncbi:variable large family protein [Borrelia turicatae]|uniref:variable large family protein n=1 Tax=Borrelia turicatae TaxID=142 RepID=UPI001FF2D275|nr:variable large family protein [Borrelia turicatae]UPA15666.1 variable large family protein [Borrelia turicatae]
MKRITLSVLLMTLFLLLSCGSGSSKAEDPTTLFLTSIANLGKGFLDVFTSLSDMVAGAFGINAETKKEDIGKYFTRIADTMNTVKAKLNDVVAKNGNYPKVKTAVDEFVAILGKIEEGSKEAAKGVTGDVIIGNTVKNSDAVPGEATSVKAIVKGIKAIVDIVLKKDEGKADADATKDDSKKDIGKLFTAITDANRADNAAALFASVIAVAPAKDNKKEIKHGAKKDAIIAAGIALRAMAKNGKFAANQNAKDSNAVNGVAANAVGKTLSTLIIAIRNTVDSGLKSINAALATVTQEDKSVDSTTPTDAATGGQ